MVVLGIMTLAILTAPSFGLAHAASYTWAAPTSLAQIAYEGPALAYNPGLGKVFMAYPPGNQCCGTVNVISSSDMTTWNNNIDTHQTVTPGKLGLVYNSDDQRMYIAYSDFTDITGTAAHVYVISSSDGAIWSTPTLVLDDFDCSNCPGYGINGPMIVFDNPNHRLLLEYASFVSTGGGSEVFLNQSYGPVFGRNWSALSTNPVSLGGIGIRVYDTPYLSSINGKLYMAYVTMDKSLHVIQSTDGITWGSKVDISGQTGYAMAIDYNPNEGLFHLFWQGTDGPHTLNDITSPDALSWSGQIVFSGPNPAETDDYFALSYVSSLGRLLVGFTGTDGGGAFGATCPCSMGHLNVMPQIPIGGGGSGGGGGGCTKTIGRCPTKSQ
jgi:hypothetical protein